MELFDALPQPSWLVLALAALNVVQTIALAMLARSKRFPTVRRKHWNESSRK